MSKALLALCALILFTGMSLATTPIKLSLWNKIAAPTNDSVTFLEIGIGTYTPNLTGIGLNCIYSKTDEAIAWQMGFVTISKQFIGLQTGLLNLTEILEGLSLGLYKLQ